MKKNFEIAELGGWLHYFISIISISVVLLVY